MIHKFLILTCLLSAILLAVSCGSQKEKETKTDNEFKKIENYFKTTHNYEIGNDINKIVVIGEGNSCGTCEKAFAQVAFQYLTDSSVFLLTAKGNNVDINPYMQLKENCFFDWQLNTIEYENLSGSRVIYLKNKEIDTTIIINSAQIMEQLEYIKN